MAIRSAQKYLGDKIVRTAPPHKILDPKAGLLIAVKLYVLTRNTLGGIETNLNAQTLSKSDEPIEVLYAAGEAAGFGGGGMHGYNALEWTFLRGCILSGMKAGQAIGVG